MVKVSVVVPVYNAEKYLIECLDSIRSQTLKDIEIICVNDASTDASLEILKMYQGLDDRLIILDQIDHIGAALCRNKGLGIAKGKYIIFLDSDDIFYKNMLKKTYEVVEKESADVVLFGYHLKDLDKEGEVIRSEKKTFQRKVYNEKENFLDIIQKDSLAPWNKLVRLKFIRDNNIGFQDLPNCNDIYYSLAVIFLSSKTAFSEDVLLDYHMHREGSLSSAKRNGEYYIIDAYDAFFSLLLKNGTDEEVIRNFIYYALRNYWYIMMKSSFGSKSKEFVNGRIKKSELFKYVCTKSDEEVGFVVKKFLQDILDQKCRGMFEYFAEAVRDIVMKTRKRNMKIVLWGCGVRGRRLLDELKKDEIAIDYVVDMSKCVREMSYQGYDIFDYSAVRDDVHIILLTNSAFLDEIREMTDNKIIIDLNTYSDKKLEKQLKDYIERKI